MATFYAQFVLEPQARARHRRVPGHRLALSRAFSSSQTAWPESSQGSHRQDHGHGSPPSTPRAAWARAALRPLMIGDDATVRRTPHARRDPGILPPSTRETSTVPKQKGEEKDARALAPHTGPGAENQSHSECDAPEHPHPNGATKRTTSPSPLPQRQGRGADLLNSHLALYHHAHHAHSKPGIERRWCNAAKFQSKRERNAALPVVAIVGYTNAGKSTLLNHLTERGGFQGG